MQWIARTEKDAVTETLWRLAKTNLAIRSIDAQIAHGEMLHNGRHPDLRADYVLANPPFYDADLRGQVLQSDKRWLHGASPAIQFTVRDQESTRSVQT